MSAQRDGRAAASRAQGVSETRNGRRVGPSIGSLCVVAMPAVKHFPARGRRTGKLLPNRGRQPAALDGSFGRQPDHALRQRLVQLLHALEGDLRVVDFEQFQIRELRQMDQSRVGDLRADQGKFL